MDTIFVLGAHSRAELIATWPAVRRVEVIPLGDLRVLADGGEVAPPGDCPERIVMFGSLTGYKGLDLLLEAFAIVRRQRPDATLDISGPVVGDLDIESLRRRVAELPGADLRPGYVPAPDVPGLIGSARLVAAPYRRSNASAVVRLAHTLGRPVVVTDVGDLADSVETGVTGLIVPPNDVEALAGALERLLADPDAATRMGDEGRARLFAGSSWEVVAGRLENIYRELLAG
jgi:glycosyltransferase involved in cell wall biosynthesis